MMKRKASLETALDAPPPQRRKLSIISKKISSTKILSLSSNACSASFKVNGRNFVGIFFKTEHIKLLVNDYDGVINDPFGDTASFDGASYDFYRMMVLFNIDKLKKIENSNLSFNGSVISTWINTNIYIIDCNITQNDKRGPPFKAIGFDSKLIDFSAPHLIPEKIFNLLKTLKFDEWVNDKTMNRISLAKDKNKRSRRKNSAKYCAEIGSYIFFRDEESEKISFFFSPLLFT